VKNTYKAAIAALTFLTLLAPSQVRSQLVPQPWVSVGVNDDITYSVGARSLGFGVELGTDSNGATGVDVLKFFDLPTSVVGLPGVSPYAGVGLYSNDAGISLSGGVQVEASKNITVGAGYNSVRGLNGQIGIRF
jgi:opacity protein-like surface antigen